MVALNEADLQPLSMKELMNLTDEHGVAEHLVDSAMDADDPKEELIKLLCGGKPAGGKPTRKNGKPRLPMLVTGRSLGQASHPTCLST